MFPASCFRASFRARNQRHLAAISTTCIRKSFASCTYNQFRPPPSEVLPSLASIQWQVSARVNTPRSSQLTTGIYTRCTYQVLVDCQRQTRRFHALSKSELRSQSDSRETEFVPHLWSCEVMEKKVISELAWPRWHCNPSTLYQQISEPLLIPGFPYDFCDTSNLWQYSIL